MDATNGVTPETGLTIGSADQAEVLKANGAATVAMGGTLAAVTGCDGWYDYTVQTGEVDTLGEVVFVLQDESIALPVWVRGMVVSAAAYDRQVEDAGVIVGETSGTPTTTSAATDLAGYGTDELINRTVVFTDGQAGTITAQTSGGTLTYSEIATAPAASLKFYIV